MAVLTIVPTLLVPIHVAVEQDTVWPLTGIHVKVYYATSNATLAHYHSMQLSDIDECALNTDGCAHNCFNIIGSYTCSCRTGYSLATDRQSCEGIIMYHNYDFKCFLFIGML